MSKKRNFYNDVPYNPNDKKSVKEFWENANVKKGGKKDVLIKFKMSNEKIKVIQKIADTRDCDFNDILNEALTYYLINTEK